jgi:hypothetical protein
MTVEGFRDGDHLEARLQDLQAAQRLLEACRKPVGGRRRRRDKAIESRPRHARLSQVAAANRGDLHLYDLDGRLHQLLRGLGGLDAPHVHNHLLRQGRADLGNVGKLLDLVRGHFGLTCEQHLAGLGADDLRNGVHRVRIGRVPAYRRITHLMLTRQLCRCTV